MLYIWFCILPLLGLIIGWTVRWVYAKFQLSSSEQKAERIKQDAVKEAEAIKKELVLETKDQLLKERNQQEREFRDRRAELQKQERRLIQKEDNLDNKLGILEKQTQEIADRERGLKERDSVLTEQENVWRKKLEEVSQLTAEQAKQLIIQSMENEAKHDAQALLNKIEQEAQLSAEKKAREILVTTIQRVATEVAGDITVTSVSLPTDEMKGRIIGREGRNIRTLETLTGVDIIIDDTPEAVVLSCFDPVKKEIAKEALERLVMDGRIHPARIEDVVQKVTKDINQVIYDEGEKVLFDVGIHNMPQEGIRALGRLHFRTSYGQNVLQHSKEVAIIAGLIAAELGANRALAHRAALLHDIGKGVESDGEGNHAEVGMEIARKMGEDPRVVNAIGAHHNDIEPTTLEAIIVQIADAISAARPGARKETIDNYIKRLENLENVALQFDGIEKAYAIQAGRELRILVNSDQIDDEKAADLCRQITKKIETDLRYPGRIRVTIIRETRIVEYAR